jgi:hypothetical protein
MTSNEGEDQGIYFEGLYAKPAGILVNAYNQGDCTGIFDADSLDFFCQNVSKIENYVNRALIWMNLGIHVDLGLLAP